MIKQKQIQSLNFEKQEREQGYLMDALEGISNQGMCEHTPDVLEYQGTEMTTHGLASFFECGCCGKILLEKCATHELIVL